MLDNDIYLWLHRQLGEQREVTLTEFKTEFPNDSYSANFAEEYLDRLTRQGILNEQACDRYVVVDEQAERQEYYKLLEPSTKTPTLESQAVHQPVMGVPSQLQSEWEEFAERNGISAGITLKDALKEVFNQSGNTLRLIVPYFEVDGLNLLDEEFLKIAEDGVSVEILTREALTDADDFGKNKRRKALLEAIDRYEKVAPSDGSIKIRDYYFAIGSEQPKLDRSVHAKVAIADDNLAYVGSGEVRDSSMHLNGEAGYLSREPTEVEGWRGFFDFFWNRSETVSRYHLDH